MRRRLVLAVCATLAGLAASQPVLRAQTPTFTRARYVFSSVGFVSGEAIHVSVVNKRTQPPPDPDKIRITILDSLGHKLADSGAVTIGALHTHSFSVTRDELTAAGDDKTGRLQVRVVVLFSNPGGYPPGPCRPGVEIVSTATGHTIVFTDPPDPEQLP